MSTKQVISIALSGAISGLQAKPGKGFDLRVLGKAEIKRASEVLWNADKQKWYVEIRSGRYAGKVITLPMLSMVSGQPVAYKASEDTAYFPEYDDAVAAEIAVLDYIRKTEGPEAL